VTVLGSSLKNLALERGRPSWSTARARREHGPHCRHLHELALGGGIDTKIHPEREIYWRIFQGGYLLTQFGGNAQNNFRFSTGILARF